MGAAGMGSHERIHQRRQHGTRAEQDDRAQDQEQDDQGNQPPLLLLAEEEKEFFAQLPHAAPILSSHGLRSKISRAASGLARKFHAYSLHRAPIRRPFDPAPGWPQIPEGKRLQWTGPDRNEWRQARAGSSAPRLRATGKPPTPRRRLPGLIDARIQAVCRSLDISQGWRGVKYPG